MFVYIQNLIYTDMPDRDGLSESLTAECRELPRKFDLVEAQKERMTNMVDALERAHDKVKGMEEGEAMRTNVSTTM